MRLVIMILAGVATYLGARWFLDFNVITTLILQLIVVVLAGAEYDYATRRRAAKLSAKSESEEKK